MILRHRLCVIHFNVLISNVFAPWNHISRFKSNHEPRENTRSWNAFVAGRESHAVEFWAYRLEFSSSIRQLVCLGGLFCQLNGPEQESLITMI